MLPTKFHWYWHIYLQHHSSSLSCQDISVAKEFSIEKLSKCLDTISQVCNTSCLSALDLFIPVMTLVKMHQCLNIFSWQLAQCFSFYIFPQEFNFEKKKMIIFLKKATICGHFTLARLITLQEKFSWFPLADKKAEQPASSWNFVRRYMYTVWNGKGTMAMNHTSLSTKLVWK